MTRKTIWVCGLGCLLVLTTSAQAQQPAAEIQVPLERYSVSPFLEDPFLILQGSTLSDAIKLDLSLGLKYQKEPWRIFESQNSDFKQSPVEDQFQLRPALSFAFRRWFDLAVVVPLSFQTAGDSEMFPGVSGQEGFHLMNPEIFVKVPVLHERLAGFGLAGLLQFILPYGADDSFTNYPALQGGVALALDWRRAGFGAALNSGVWLRESSSRLEATENRLHTDLGHELFIRPGVFYAFEMAGYALAVMAEGNIATSLSGLFGNHNENAFQFMLSVQFQPAATGSGFYAALGSGARMQGGGYGVPLANLDARLGYSLQWLPGSKEPARVAAAQPTTTETASQPAAEQPEAAGEWQKGQPSQPQQPAPEPEEAEEVAEATLVPGGEAPPPTPVAAATTTREVPGGREQAPVAAQRPAAVGGGPAGPSLVTINFAPNQPAAGPLQAGLGSGSAAIPDSARRQVRALRSQIAQQLAAPGARLVVIGYADKCFDGPPPLANEFNRQLSQRRAQAMVQVLKEELGQLLQGVDIRTVAMGRLCANPACQCSNPDMPECANDRRVDLHIDHGETTEFTCPGAPYWLAR